MNLEKQQIFIHPILFFLSLSLITQRPVLTEQYFFSVSFFSVLSFSQLQSYILHINAVFKITILMTYSKKALLSVANEVHQKTPFKHLGRQSSSTARGRCWLSLLLCPSTAP